MFYSQFGQDKAVRELFLNDTTMTIKGHEHNSEPRVFLDVGAGDGIVDSNTRHFEERGWRGVCFEPDPVYFADLKKNREQPCLPFAVAEQDGKRRFWVVPVRGWSRFENGVHHKNSNLVEQLYDVGEVSSIVVQAFSLRTLLEAGGLVEQVIRSALPAIDYLSIDVEGAELEVLHGIAWSRLEIRVLTVEMNKAGSQIKSLLQRRGFALWGTLGEDAMFVNKDWLLRGMP